jgi:hypothetical protein
VNQGLRRVRCTVCSATTTRRSIVDHLLDEHPDTRYTPIYRLFRYVGSPAGKEQ